MNRVVQDHTATPSSWRRVDGVEVMIEQTRRDTLIHALASTKFSARKPPSLSLSNPYFARFLFWINAFMVPSGSSGMVRVLCCLGTVPAASAALLPSCGVDGFDRAALRALLVCIRARPPCRRVQRSVWGGCCRRTRTSGNRAHRVTEGRLYAWRDGSEGGARFLLLTLAGLALLPNSLPRRRRRAARSTLLTL